jgi:class 3 adenylate cyclase
MLGTIGIEGRFDYAAIRTVSNVASRLCDEAKPGQIFISPRVLVAVENTVQVEPVEATGAPLDYTKNLMTRRNSLRQTHRELRSLRHPCNHPDLD